MRIKEFTVSFIYEGKIYEPETYQVVEEESSLENGKINYQAELVKAIKKIIAKKQRYGYQQKLLILYWMLFTNKT
jgi:hypothetical protein